MPGTEQGHRCFFAVEISGEATAYLARIVAELRRHGADVRWTPPGNLHLTLRFLGEISDEQLDRARRITIDESTREKFTLRASGLGAFPSLRSPSVLWAGIDGEEREDLEKLRRLQSHTEQWAQSLGIAPERRRYSPHVTLGRVRRAGEGLRELIEDITVRSCYSEPSLIGELLLVRSILASSGAVYETVERWKL